MRDSVVVLASEAWRERIVANKLLACFVVRLLYFRTRAGPKREGQLVETLETWFPHSRPRQALKTKLGVDENVETVLCCSIALATCDAG